MRPLKTVANLNFLPTVSKGRKPKFELHLKIYDLNNVPLVSGGSVVKWHLLHSIHAEHRGRTHKCPIANHKVEFNYAKVVGHIRIGLDKNNHLNECPLELEISQELSSSGLSGGRDEKIVLGTVRLNLSEYVEESEALPRTSATATNPVRNGRERTSLDKAHLRKRSTSNSIGGGTGASSTSSRPASSSGTTAAEDADVEEGIARRYLMQDSKINSTIKIGILMVQVDGDRNYVAPPLKTAPVFGGIAGIMSGDQVEQDDAGQLPSIAKSREQAEVQDMYRKALAASWTRQPGELPADQCIEDIFAGGNGWADSSAHAKPKSSLVPQRNPSQTSQFSLSSGGYVSSRSRGTGAGAGAGLDGGAETSDDGEGSSSGQAGDTLRPGDYRRMRRQQHQPTQHHGSSLMHAFSPQRHRHKGSNASDKSVSTVTGRHNNGSGFGFSSYPSSGSQSRDESRHRHDDSTASSRDDLLRHDNGRSRSESLTSLAPTMGSGSSGGRGGGRGDVFRRAREIEEVEVRDDMVAWSLPSDNR
ncbi:hypothetical protein BN1723_011259 [Verticillium longisporum]|uniref:C2 NT-type domain-containing protein n=1 Tax=Verticillium longisporum TaxID=100787 RepID=A0A0G4L5U2_VERLO|nr:hypothetical protein BN1723_011259 [Verticillium longisporum]